MSEPALFEAATRLGSAYAELVGLGYELDGVCLPKWMEPSRLRPLGGFDVGSKMLTALHKSPLYKGHSAARKKQYNDDLRVFHAHLKSALISFTNDSLARQQRELRKLGDRLERPAIEDRLHESALRVGNASGGLRGNSKDLTEIHKDLPDERRWAPSEQVEFYEGRHPLTRKRVLAALREERDAIEKQGADGLDPREVHAQSEAREIPSLLAVLSVHPDMVQLLDLYAQSPLKGTERANDEISRAVEATERLRSRLTEKEESDDAWGYAPLVVGAVTALGLKEMSGLPEFAVAMGRMLAKTKTAAIIGGATMLLIGLSLVFIGPVGVVVVGVLDLALAGINAGIALLRVHEQEIAATATDFSPKDQKLAAHGEAGDAGLDVAAALLSAIALIGPAKQLMHTQPRSPNVLKPVSKKQSNDSPLELDFSDHSKGFFPELDELEQVNRAGNLPNEMSAATMKKRAERTGSRTRVGENWELSSDKMRRQSKTTGSPEFGSGPSPDQQLDLSDHPSAPAPDFDYRDLNAFDPAELENPLPVNQPLNTKFNAQEFTKADILMGHEAALEVDLVKLYERKKERVVEKSNYRDRFTGLFVRDNSHPKFKELKKQLESMNAPDPIIPAYRFSSKNPGQVDHIIAEDIISQFVGFGDLNPKFQLEILHMEENLEIVTAAVNTSRKEMPYAMWEGTAEFKIPPDIRILLIAREQELANKIQKRIKELLEKQREMNGTFRPASGAANVGSRSTAGRLAGDVSRAVRLKGAMEDQDRVNQ